MSLTRKFLSMAGALTLLVAFGCAEEPEVTTTATTDRGIAETTTTEEVPRLPDGSEPVQVTLSNGTIEMPSTLPEGVTLFTVRNQGDNEHSFEIEGQGMEEALDRPLQPEEVTTIEIDLTPGEYRVYCPVEGHAEKGMEMTLTVTAADGTGAPTTTEDADTEI